MEEFLIFMFVSTGGICSTCIFISEIVMVMISFLQEFVSSSFVCNHTGDWQIELPLRSGPILLITCIITDRIGLPLVPLRL